MSAPHGLCECERSVPASAILEHFRDFLYQRFSREGFGQIRPLASLKALAGDGIFRVAGDEDGSKTAAKQRELGSQVATVAVGQYHIGEQQMDSFALAVQGAKSFRGSSGLQHPIARRGQDFTDYVTHEDLIFNQENCLHPVGDGFESGVNRGRHHNPKGLAAKFRRPKFHSRTSRRSRFQIKLRQGTPPDFE